MGELIVKVKYQAGDNERAVVNYLTAETPIHIEKARKIWGFLKEVIQAEADMAFRAGRRFERDSKELFQ